MGPSKNFLTIWQTKVDPCQKEDEFDAYVSVTHDCECDTWIIKWQIENLHVYHVFATILTTQYFEKFWKPVILEDLKRLGPDKN